MPISRKRPLNTSNAPAPEPIDPMNFNNYAGLGSAHEVLQDYDNAAALYRRALLERPNANWIYRNLASSCRAPAGSMRQDRRSRKCCDFIPI
jgi:tetratricopeptide (TPR) repeat protein